jgi:hypothetical protein
MISTNEILFGFIGCSGLEERYKYFRIPKLIEGHHFVFDREIEWMTDDELREALIRYSEKVFEITKLLREKEK